MNKEGEQRVGGEAIMAPLTRMANSLPDLPEDGLPGLSF
jgi:hypothetical protein